MTYSIKPNMAIPTGNTKHGNVCRIGPNWHQHYLLLHKLKFLVLYEDLMEKDLFFSLLSKEKGNSEDYVHTILLCVNTDLENQRMDRTSWHVVRG